MSVMKELRAKLEAATPGKLSDGDPCVYSVDEHGVTYFGEVPHPCDRALLVSAINALPALLAVVEAAEKVRCGHCGNDSFAKSCTRCGDLRRSLAALASLTRNDEVDRG